MMETDPRDSEQHPTSGVPAADTKLEPWLELRTALSALPSIALALFLMTIALSGVGAAWVATETIRTFIAEIVNSLGVVGSLVALVVGFIALEALLALPVGVSLYLRLSRSKAGLRVARRLHSKRSASFSLAVAEHLLRHPIHRPTLLACLLAGLGLAISAHLQERAAAIQIGVGLLPVLIGVRAARGLLPQASRPVVAALGHLTFTWLVGFLWLDWSDALVIGVTIAAIIAAVAGAERLGCRNTTTGAAAVAVAASCWFGWSWYERTAARGQSTAIQPARRVCHLSASRCPVVVSGQPSFTLAFCTSSLAQDNTRRRSLRCPVVQSSRAT